ncbi:MAG: serine protease, partial [Chloroflexota bacterium]|nr:serine protease [Chloroflexota bacterium]
MTNENYPVIDDTGKKKRRTGWIIGCSAAFVIVLCLVLFVVLGGFALFRRGGTGLTVGVVTPTSPLKVGQQFEIQVDLANEGTEHITIDQIELPPGLLEVAEVRGVSPYDGQTVSSDQAEFDFAMEIAPTGQQTVTISLDAARVGEARGDIVVRAGGSTVSASIMIEVSDGTTTGGAVMETPMTESMDGGAIPYLSVVQIVAVVDMDGERVEGWTGSGTIISSDGLILTNAHVVLSDRYYDVVDLVVAITVGQDQPPQQMFYADVVQADVDMDLAVIKVRSKLDDSEANFGSLGIPPVPLGNSDSLALGDPLVIIGYPGIGGETITLTRGEVSGFTAEVPYGNRAYIKTSATIAGGNSGGLAANPDGEIIGIPSAVGTGNMQDQFVDCRRLADTNRDGIIDEYDNCVPTGGFINALRPIQMAMPLVTAARNGEVAIVESAPQPPQEDYDPEGDVIFSDDFSDNSYGWGLGEFSSGSVDIDSGRLEIALNTTDYLVWSYLPDTYYDPVILVVNAEMVYPAGDGDFGFVCGMQDAANFTALEISEDGWYTIYQYVNDEFISLVDWEYSELIPASGPYTLSAYCGADRLALAVNGNLLAETTDAGLAAGRIGLVAGTLDNPNLIVGF